MPALVDLFSSVCAKHRDADLRLGMLALLDTLWHSTTPVLDTSANTGRSMSTSTISCGPHGVMAAAAADSTLSEALGTAAPRFLLDAMLPNAGIFYSQLFFFFKSFNKIFSLFPKIFFFIPKIFFLFSVERRSCGIDCT